MLNKLFKKEICRFYKFPKNQSCTRALVVPSGFRLEVYEDRSMLPDSVKDRVFPRGRFNIMKRRLRAGMAKLLVLFDAQQQVVAYGWVQDWRLFLSKFKKVAADGKMLGYYWTHPDHRGKGFYGVLLNASIAMSNPGDNLLIYTSPDNRASMRGIEKAGFKFLLECSLLRIFYFFNFCQIISLGSETEIS